jgi:hypothetical protein
VISIRQLIRASALASIVILTANAMALDWENIPGGRGAILPAQAGGKPGFTRMPPSQTGVTFSNVLSLDRYITNQIFLNGSGVAAGDVDGDGWCDLYFCGIDSNNVLYRNLGNWKFQDITTEAGVGYHGGGCTGAAFADIDGDGDLDLIVNTVGHGTDIFLNDGKGHFTKTRTLNQNRGAMSLALADIDGDGLLDLYIANYRASTIRDEPTTHIEGENLNGQMVIRKVNGRPLANSPYANRISLDPFGKMLEEGEPDALFHNDGNGNFTPIPFTGAAFLDEDGRSLREPPYDWGLSVMFRDINGDGAPDIYVCNDFHSPDRIWLNDGHGHFRAAPRLTLRHSSMFSMGVDFADVNRDGFDDFFVADMLSRSHRRRNTQLGNYAPQFLPIGEIENRPQYSFNTLQLNRGDGTFAEIAHFSGVEASDWSWTPVFLDVDLDGYEDLLITTGLRSDTLNSDIINAAETKKGREKLGWMEGLQLKKLFPRLATSKVAFRNRGDLTFEEVAAQWGLNTAAVSHGMTLADLDNDGDLDLIVNNMDEPAEIYRNDSAAPRVAIRLKGAGVNTRGIGAKIKLAGGRVAQSQEMICGGRYLSSDDAIRVFAPATTVKIDWRDGKQSIIDNLKANYIYEIDEARSSTANPPAQKEAAVKPLFEDASDLVKHIHHEEPYDDFARQPMLPNRLSQLGPGVCWHDFDGDGFEDLFIGSGRGGQFAAYRNEGKGGLVQMREAMFDRPVSRDQTGLVAFGSMLIAGSANYEDGVTNGGCIRIYDLQRKATGESILGETFSRGPLALADFDGDGALDLFIGGRVIPGRYPEAATSLLLRNENGRFVSRQRFEGLGLISGAVFSDLDGDGKPELILACEWGPVRVFQNQNGKFAEITEKIGLAKYLGWWNGVTTGDFDGDGRMDIVASNWGLNSKYRATAEHPRKLYYGDINAAGAVDLVEAYYDSDSGKEVPERVLKAAAVGFPFLQATFPTYEAYSVAGVQEIYGDKLKTCRVLEANTLASTLFLNRGDHFEAVPLPPEAQFAPAFGISVADCDGDGKEDIFLSQNFFATAGDTTRCDAGRGLWLRGDGTGHFKALFGQESGVLIYGEQRGCAVADYDGDGRIDLVVSQNGAATKLFHNVGAKPGLRVKLVGDDQNMAAIGASMRLLFGDKQGPLREIHAGSGYWSQDGAIQILATPEPPKQIWIRWPGGKTIMSDIPANANFIEIRSTGSLRVIR